MDHLQHYFSAFLNQGVGYFLIVAFLCLLVTESALKSKELRWLFASSVYLTIGLWYLVDPVYSSEVYSHISLEEYGIAYTQVAIFLFTFRLLIPTLAPTPTRLMRAFNPQVIERTEFVFTVVVVWLLLFLIGMWRVDFRVVEALFPLDSRASWGTQMWARPRLGGSFDFLISVGDYTYMFVCAMFGLIAAATVNTRVRWLMLALAAATWPMFLLEGSRHKVIIVALPAIAAIVLLKPWSTLQKATFVIAVLAVANFLMLVAITYRNVGVGEFFRESERREMKHLGLNMTEELVYINRFQDQGLLTVEWGHDYFANAMNFIPRAVWANKPEVGVEFNKLRMEVVGGVSVGTVSRGIVGQGVTNFGTWVGPIAPAVIMAMFGLWLCALPLRGMPFLRACLVMVCLTTIPTFGRDITMFTFWPIVFGAAGIFVYESRMLQMRRSVPGRV